MDADEAVTQLLGVDTKLGILAGLALVAKKQQELQSEDEDANGTTATNGTNSPNDRREGGGGNSNRKTQRSKRNGSFATHPGAENGSVLGTQPSSTASKKYSVHDQRNVIRKLQEQNQILKQELAIEFRDAKTLLSHEKRQQFDRLHTMAATFLKKIDLIKKNTARVDELLVKKAQELEAIRQQQHSETTGGSSGSIGSSSGSSNASSAESSSGLSAATSMALPAENSAASTRRVRALENRLELSLVKKNEMDSINKHLRVQIEKVRKDRVIFDGIYKKLEKEMSEYRQRHELSVEELRKAMDAKNQVDLEILRIQSQAEQEQRTYEQQFQELKASIETSMREAARLSGAGVGGAGTGPSLALGSPFSSKPHHHRHSDPDDSASGLGMSGGGPNSGANAASGGLGHAPSDSPLNRISVLSTWKIGYDRALATTNEDVIAKYEKAFAGIKQLTGIRDITKIAEEIVNRDDANFKHFKRAEELHAEEVALHAQIDELTCQIEAFKAQEGIATSATQKQQFRELDVKYQQALGKAKAYDDEFEDTATTLTRIKSSVHSIHSMLVHANCARNVDKFSHGSAHLALGSHSARDVTDTNVLEYLQAIETFATSLMKETHEAASAAAVAAGTATTSGGSSGTGGGSLEDSSTLTGGGLPLGLQSTSSGLLRHQEAAAAIPSPIGHGPLTLPSDPSQKLRVHVPSPGGVNGVIIIPASSPFGNSDSSANGGHAAPRSPTKALQQQQQQQQLHLHQGLQRRKSGGRFELMARKSLSQVQFAAALAAAVAANNDQTLLPFSSHITPDHNLLANATNGISNPSDGSNASVRNLGPRTPGSSSSPSSQLSRAKLEEEEEERALTYDELRQYAAKNVVKKKSDDASSSVSNTRASTGGGGSTINNGSGVSPSKATTAKLFLPI